MGDDMTTSNNITIEQKEETEEKSDEENKGEEKTQTTSTGAADGADGAVDPTALKKAATSAFKSGDLAKALELFQQASSAFEKYDDSSNIEARIKCLNNAALCGQHLGDNDLVVSVCTTVLTLDKENVKALLRRGIAYEELADYNNALDDMCTIMRVSFAHSGASAFPGLNALLGTLPVIRLGEGAVVIVRSGGLVGSPVTLVEPLGVIEVEEVEFILTGWDVGGGGGSDESNSNEFHYEFIVFYSH